MDLDKVEIVNFRAFGEKVKAWAKGTETVPATIQEFAEQLGAAEVGAKIPERLKRIRFVQDDEETLTIRLPCRGALEIAETRLANEGGSYPLPPFY
jgi:hypothetical protein